MHNNDRYKLLFNQLWQHKTLTKELPNISINSNDLNKNILAINNNFTNIISNQANPNSAQSEQYNVNKKLNSNINDTIKYSTSTQVPTANLTINNHTLNNKQDLTNSITQLRKYPPITQPLTQHINLISNWDELLQQINSCNKCILCSGRKNVVIERGNRNAQIMFVGEGPGEHEDKQGLPFVGLSGQLLDKMIKAMKLNIQLDTYICNVVKCRPPHNRNPENNEINSCNNYLLSQINLVQPKLIIALGRFAGQTLLNTHLATSKLRGTIHYFNSKTPVIVTYHPSYLLRNPSAKKAVWEDLQSAMQILAAS